MGSVRHRGWNLCPAPCLTARPEVFLSPIMSGVNHRAAPGPLPYPFFVMGRMKVGTMRGALRLGAARRGDGKRRKRRREGDTLIGKRQPLNHPDLFLFYMYIYTDTLNIFSGHKNMKPLFFFLFFLFFFFIIISSPTLPPSFPFSLPSFFFLSFPFSFPLCGISAGTPVQAAGLGSGRAH